MTHPHLEQRRTGILLHPTSLPSAILDGDVERWLQMMSDCGFSVWQVLPLGEPQAGLSPYQCSSAFAFNPMLLAEFPAIDESDNDFKEFCHLNAFWLDDYTLFKVLKQHFDDTAWTQWPKRWKFRDEQALNESRLLYGNRISGLKWQQYQLYKRWHEIKRCATALGIRLFGDMPIFVGHDSADVWAHPEWFLLDEQGEMTVVTGVPPDYFSETGQRWGNPHYDWDAMRESDFSWWRSRIINHLEQFDLVRIDHFRGLESAWVIDAGCETAVDGHWQKMPGDELLSNISSHIGQRYDRLPFVAEDLGVITPEVTALKKKYHLPGMSILQFGFDEFEDNPHKPQNIEEETVVYTGTHDNDTTKGWFNNLDEHVKKHVMVVLGIPVEPGRDDNGSGDSIGNIGEGGSSNCWTDSIDPADRVVERLVDSAMHSRAEICIIPLQDCLHLGSEARMNTPGTTIGNWQWRFDWSMLEVQHYGDRMKKMRQRNEASQRLPERNK